MQINISNLDVKNHLDKLIKDTLEYKLCQHHKYLYLENDNLKLHHDNKELFIDFNDSETLNRINPKAKKCSVVQAVEGRSRAKLTILDTTAGLGSDTVTLAARGHTLITLEKDPYLYLLLKDALQRAQQIYYLKEIITKITLINIDSNHYILTTDKSFDCVYVDPMFPSRKKSAKVKQGMQILHQVAFNDEISNSNLLDNIIQGRITKKAVVKRPINAGFLSNKKPSSQLKVKANRFDIYSL